MRLLIVIFNLLILERSFGQKEDFTEYRIDTFYLKDFSAKKLVGYKISDVTIFVNYDDYKPEHFRLWSIYSGDSTHPTTEKGKTFRVIDSTYKYLTTEILTHDTVFIFQEVFDKVSIGPMIDFTNVIENSACIIVDKRGIRQNTIIRQKGSIVKGFDDGWGGRRYFLSNSRKWFFESLDWIY